MLNHIIHKNLIKLFFLLVFISISKSSFSDIPLTIEDLTTDKNRIKLITNINYLNKSQRDLYDQGYSYIDLNDGNTITLPNTPIEGTSIVDNVIGSIGLNYGVTDKWEIGIKANAIYKKTRINNVSTTSKTESYLQDFSFNTQYQLIDNHDYLPNGLVFSELSLYDKTAGFSSKKLSSVLLGSTFYTINDPIILSVSGSYQYNKERKFLDQNQKFNLGDIVTLNGSLGFAVNPDITLNAGVGWQFKKSDKINGKNIDIKKTQTELNLGVAYSLSQRTNLIANIRANISGKEGSVFSIGFTTKLGELPPPLSERYRKIKNNL